MEIEGELFKVNLSTLQSWKLSSRADIWQSQELSLALQYSCPLHTPPTTVP